MFNMKFIKELIKINNKLKEKKFLTSKEMEILKEFAEKDLEASERKQKQDSEYEKWKQKLDALDVNTTTIEDDLNTLDW